MATTNPALPIDVFMLPVRCNYKEPINFNAGNNGDGLGIHTWAFASMDVYTA